MCNQGTSAPAPAADQAYSAEPLLGSPFGVEVRNFSLTLPMEPSVIERIKRDVSRCVLQDHCCHPAAPDCPQQSWPTQTTLYCPRVMVGT